MVSQLITLVKSNSDIPTKSLAVAGRIVGICFLAWLVHQFQRFTLTNSFPCVALEIYITSWGCPLRYLLLASSLVSVTNVATYNCSYLENHIWELNGSFTVNCHIYLFMSTSKIYLRIEDPFKYESSYSMFFLCCRQSFTFVLIHAVIFIFCFGKFKYM